MLCSCFGSSSSKETTEIDKVDKGNRCATVAKSVIVALAIIALVAGIAGSLVCSGHLGLSWTGLGSMSQMTGFYVAVGGLIATGIITLLAVVTKCQKYCRAKSNEPTQHIVQ